MINELPITLKKLKLKDNDIIINYVLDNDDETKPMELTVKLNWYEHNISNELRTKLITSITSLKEFVANILHIVDDRQLLHFIDNRMSGYVPEVMRPTWAEIESTMPLIQKNYILDFLFVNELVFDEMQFTVILKGEIYKSRERSKYSTPKIALIERPEDGMLFNFYEPMLIHLQELENHVYSIINTASRKQDSQLKLFNQNQRLQTSLLIGNNERG